MRNAPRTREFYRPILEDLHAAARVCRGKFSFLLEKEMVFLTVGFFGGVVVLVGLVLITAYHNHDAPSFFAVPAANQAQMKSALQQRGAEINRASDGHLIIIVDSVAFSDNDLQLLSEIEFLRSLTIIDAGVTDDGLLGLRNLPHLQQILLIDTRVTSEGVKRFQSVSRSPKCVVRIIGDPPDIED